MVEIKYFKPGRVAEMVGEEHVEEILKGYLTSVSDVLTDLRTCWLKKDLEQVRVFSHRIKSSTRLIGADDLADDFQQIETDTESAELNICDDMSRLTGIEVKCNHLKEEIESYLNSATH
ncbi:Hpt domain-containing protein [Vibrio quintilis]|uniref:Hpt domain protein n=1 Tax=Vibrio quintilis TaxID=1117707 RepID=A0A1M7YY05_9VIBR|nr:Hpt domain-containing protein [Vibrio quintilis]SHO57433.1 Hpt domain protein [Vibrio quintilis]